MNERGRGKRELVLLFAASCQPVIVLRLGLVAFEKILSFQAIVIGVVFIGVLAAMGWLYDVGVAPPLGQEDSEL